MKDRITSDPDLNQFQLEAPISTQLGSERGRVLMHGLTC